MSAVPVSEAREVATSAKGCIGLYSMWSEVDIDGSLSEMPCLIFFFSSRSNEKEVNQYRESIGDMKLLYVWPELGAMQDQDRG